MMDGPRLGGLIAGAAGLFLLFNGMALLAWILILVGGLALLRPSRGYMSAVAQGGTTLVAFVLVIVGVVAFLIPGVGWLFGIAAIALGVWLAKQRGVFA